MLYQVLIPAPVLIIPVLFMTSKCQNSSDVIVTYSQHAEAVPEGKLPPDAILHRAKTENSPTKIGSLKGDNYNSTARREFTIEKNEPIQNDVIFLPNARETDINSGYFENEKRSIGDIMRERSLDYIGKKFTTEAPKDIIFVTGKNNENEEKTKPKKMQNGPHSSHKETARAKMNCKNLDCNNTVSSVCGGKLESKTWRYRLFLNDCYFRKVNCNFRNAENRFKRVDLKNCNNVGVHRSERPRPLYKVPLVQKTRPIQVDNTRRSDGRRSLSVSVDGRFCAHTCPTSCPPDYDPECAVTHAGYYKMFVNHCQLDLHSCNNGVLWRRRPMSECVGGPKADMRQNRAFIHWMQRVGIVDNKGRLVLS